MRRLPIFFVLDVSDSMAGTPLDSLQEGINRLVRELRTDPYALETAHISIIAFAGKVKTLIPLTELFAFFPPKLPMGAGTVIGEALKHTAKEIEQHVTMNTADKKGDYQPIVYFMSDGCATDDVSSAIDYWKKQVGSIAKFIAIGIGKEADLSIFKPLTSDIFRLENSDEQSFKQFIDWVSQSVSAQSRSVGAGVSLDKIAGEKSEEFDLMSLVYEKIEANATADNNFVLLNGLCSRFKKPFLLKYKRIELPPEVYYKNPSLPENVYEFNFACALSDDYAEWSEPSSNANTVNVNELLGSGSCPHCANPYTIALCGNCEQLMCIQGVGTVDCPCCDSEQNFIAGDDGEEVNFAITRSKG